jgi:hypothetical protein
VEEKVQVEVEKREKGGGKEEKDGKAGEVGEDGEGWRKRWRKRLRGGEKVEKRENGGGR